MSEFARTTAQDAERRELCELLRADFERTRSAAGGTDHALSIAGSRIRLRFANKVLADSLLPALVHPAEPAPKDAGLVIHLWDRASGPSSLVLDALMRSLSWCWQEHLGSRGEVHGYDKGPIRASFHPGPDALSLLDYERGEAFYWVNDAARLPWHECASPLRTLLAWWAAGAGMQMVHAAAIGNADGAALIVGKGGSGKSTSALAALCAGMWYLGDDYCLVSDSPNPFVHSVYGTAKLRDENDLSKLAALSGSRAETSGDAEKLVFELTPRFGEQIAASLPLRALCVPKIFPQDETEVVPVGRGAALAALAPSTLLQLSGSGGDSLRAMSALVRAVPCFELRLGADRGGIAAAIARAIAAGSATRQ